MTGDVAALGDAISSGMVGLFRDLLILIGVGILTVWLHPRFGASVLACALVVGIPAIIIRRSAQERAASALTAISRMNGVLEENIAGQAIIRLFGAESPRGELFRNESRSALEITLATLRTRVFFDAGASLTSAVALTTIIGLGGSELSRGSLSQGLLVAFVQYAGFLLGAMRGTAEKGVALLSGLSAGERVVRILRLAPALSAPLEPKDPLATTTGISMEEASFGYAAGRDVLRGITLHIPVGRRVALIGRTGAGKTTLARLLARFYDPRVGTIRLGGVNLRNLPLPDLRRRVSFVTQTVSMFHDSVLENVRLGRSGISREAVIEACRAVQANDFIENLPGGYDAVLGATGRDLSLGERQLLSFARVLVGEPEILILDEPTANVDPKSEVLILKALDRILVGRTSPIIAHRHSTLRGADRVLLMEEGQIIADGPWSEVLPEQRTLRPETRGGGLRRAEPGIMGA